MAQDPCAFVFPYTNYSEHTALHKNFRHLERHLQRIGCGLSTEDASYVLAASDSTDHIKRRDDSTCDGVDDNLTIRDAIATMGTTGTLAMLPGTYFFGDSLRDTDDFNVQIDETFRGDLTIDGMGGAVWKFTTNPAANKAFLLHGGSGADSQGKLLRFTGIIFDAQSMTNVFSAMQSGTLTVRPLVIFDHCVFRNFDQEHVWSGERGASTIITNCTFEDCDVTSGFFNHGAGAVGSYLFVNNEFISSSGNVWSGFNNSYRALFMGNASNDGGVTINDLGAATIATHNWVGTNYESGDHTGTSHSSLSGLTTGDDHTQYMLETLADAKGDLWVASAADTAARLAVGANGKTLVAASAEATGVKWEDALKDSIWGFYDIDLAATQTAVQLTRSVGVQPVLMSYPGSIVAVAGVMSTPPTAGQVDIEVFKNGSATGLIANSAPTGVLDVSISASADDGWSDSNTNFNNSGVNGRIGKQAGGATIDTYLRFLNITIPQGSTIDVAYLTWVSTGTEGNDGETAWKSQIFCNDEDNATAPTTRATHTGKVRTTAFLQEDDATGQTTAGVSHNTGSLVAPIQEVIDRVGWVSGNALMILWDNNITAGQSRVALPATFDHLTYAAPLLHIEYTGTGAGEQYFDTVQAIGVDTFVAGDRLDVRVTTTASFTPTTADLEAGIVVQYGT